MSVFPGIADKRRNRQRGLARQKTWRFYHDKGVGNPEKVGRKPVTACGQPLLLHGERWATSLHMRLAAPKCLVLGRQGGAGVVICSNFHNANKIYGGMYIYCYIVLYIIRLTYKDNRNMDAVRNPFAPGAGSQPPELAGRQSIIDEAHIAIQRALLGKSSRSQMLLGLRGVGKTVLLNKIEEMAEAAGHLSSFIEAPEGKPLGELLLPKIHQTLRKLSVMESAKAKAHAALRALRSFASAFQFSYGETSISVDPEAGVADSGDLESDLTELFVRVGEAARDAGKAWTLLIDEVQYLTSKDLAALIVALHKINQKALPVVFFGAGLPQVAALSGDAKSYAERLFHYPPVGALAPADAQSAIEGPVTDEGASITKEALKEITNKTRGYPYFLQEWGHQCWNIAENDRIELSDAQLAAEQATKRLDDGFFKVRFDRLTPKEREYVIAMARLGDGPYRSSDIADALGKPPQSLNPVRSKIISKGMIYSPSHGDLAFTVPMFHDYLQRHFITP